MDASGIFVAVIIELSCSNISVLEQTLYAKNKQIPAILIYKEGVELSIPDLFKGMNIKAQFTFNEENKHEINKKLNRAIKNIQINNK